MPTRWLLKCGPPAGVWRARHVGGAQAAIGDCGAVAFGRCEGIVQISFIQKNSNGFELIRFKEVIFVLKIFQIKYLIEVFEKSNNFLHRNFIFELDFE
jgi:hypothetical protein